MNNKKKIAFIMSNPRIVASDGVASQAFTWKKGLESIGHKVVLVNLWNTNDWYGYDAILFFSFSPYMKLMINYISKMNKNIYVAPIFDPCASILAYKCYARWGSERLKLSNDYHSLWSIKDKIKGFLVRSKYELEYVSKVFDIDNNKITIVPLSYNMKKEEKECSFIRNNFCLHISLLCDERKNVQRLIEAAKKYRFNLVLCGLLRDKEEEAMLASWINGCDNIKYMGYVSLEKMRELYLSAKVFALPSIKEGVGIVALDAAAMGCDVVITNIGGPKEYYNGMAFEVNPYSIDSIGTAITSCLNGVTHQPQLQNLILSNNSLKLISFMIEKALCL